EHWWITSEYLYDPEEQLFYRDDRYFTRKTKNDQKVFWSRGNGWVMGGLVRVIPFIPTSHPLRARFVQQYKEMAAKIIQLQGKDGLWRSSLLDADEYSVGESSGTGFFVYALAWGINEGILPAAEYRMAVEKGWHGLVKNVNEDGRLGYVQQVGHSPEAISEDDWQVYGTGAFLLAGCEILKMLRKNL
ncbi:MAG: glycoside hydrolase family 88 protein, partial [Bacteroidota bacterium]